MCLLTFLKIINKNQFLHFSSNKIFLGTLFGNYIVFVKIKNGVNCKYSYNIEYVWLVMDQRNNNNLLASMMVKKK